MLNYYNMKRIAKKNDSSSNVGQKHFTKNKVYIVEFIGGKFPFSVVDDTGTTRCFQENSHYDDLLVSLDNYEIC